MTAEIDRALGFAPDHDAPIPYMQRTRAYYQAHRLHPPYRWAHYREVPFLPCAKPLAESRVALITTAAPYQPAKGDQGPGAAYNAGAKFYQVYSGDTAPITICASRTSAIDRSTPRRRTRHLVPAAGAAPRRRGRPDRRGGAALPWRPDQPQPRETVEIDAPEIWPAAARMRVMRRAGAELPGLPPDGAAWSRALWRRTASRRS